MVSPLWKACSAGDLQNVIELLKEASSIDIEIKGHFAFLRKFNLKLNIHLYPDHTGSTPLIEAIRNGHIEVVRALLDKGLCGLLSIRLAR
jgi:ankyrin repeat protein